MSKQFQLIALAITTILFASLPLIAQNAAYKSDPNWRAPEKSAQMKNPLAGKTEMAAGGGKIYERDCAECHGTEGGGSAKAPNLQSTDVQSQSDGALFWKMTSGNPKRGMPGWSRLPQNQRWQLVLFLRSLAKESGKQEP